MFSVEFPVVLEDQDESSPEPTQGTDLSGAEWPIVSGKPIAAASVTRKSPWRASNCCIVCAADTYYARIASRTSFERTEAGRVRIAR